MGPSHLSSAQCIPSANICSASPPQDGVWMEDQSGRIISTRSRVDHVTCLYVTEIKVYIKETNQRYPCMTFDVKTTKEKTML